MRHTLRIINENNEVIVKSVFNDESTLINVPMLSIFPKQEYIKEELLTIIRSSPSCMNWKVEEGIIGDDEEDEHDFYYTNNTQEIGIHIPDTGLFLVSSEHRKHTRIRYRVNEDERLKPIHNLIFTTPEDALLAAAMFIAMPKDKFNINDFHHQLKAVLRIIGRTDSPWV